jgi:hypothetical protein
MQPLLPPYVAGVGDLEDAAEGVRAAQLNLADNSILPPLDLVGFKLALWSLQKAGNPKFQHTRRTGVHLSVTELTAAAW